MTPVHVIEGALVGAFATAIAAANATTSAAWSIAIFIAGIAVGSACVIVADWHLRRQEQRAQSRQQGPARKEPKDA